MKVFWFLSMVTLCASCGLNSTAYCDFRPKESRCQERDGIFTTIAAFKQTCGVAQGQAGDGPCPREGIVGGCDMSEVSNPVRDWYYSDPAHQVTTPAQVMAKCDGKPYLAP